MAFASAVAQASLRSLSAWLLNKPPRPLSQLPKRALEAVQLRLRLVAAALLGGDDIGGRLRAELRLGELVIQALSVRLRPLDLLTPAIPPLPPV